MSYHREVHLNLLILNGNRNATCSHALGYRGTYRAHPSYVKHVSEADEVNQAFFWFLEEGGELGIVHDFDKARWLVSAYEKVVSHDQFEIIEVRTLDEQRSERGEFLGFDLSCAMNNSLLWWGLDFSQVIGRVIEQQFSVFLRLIESYFRPRLNRNVLFESSADAIFCLDCMLRLQEMKPELFENDAHSDFEVIALYLLH